MFEAFGEKARRALFFARWHVTRLGGTELDDVHLLLGVLQEQSEAVMRFADPAWSPEHVRTSLGTASGSRTATSPLPNGPGGGLAIVNAGIARRPS